MNQIMFSSGRQVLPPALKDFVDQTIDLMKLEIVQGLAAEAAPALITSPRTFTFGGATHRVPGAALAHRLRALGPSGKHGARSYRDRLPLESLYTSEIRSLARVYGVDLAQPRSPFDQIDKVQSFRLASADLLDAGRITRAHDNLFDVRDGDEPDSQAMSLMDAGGTPALSASTSPAIARMFAERPAATPPIGSPIGMSFIGPARFAPPFASASASASPSASTPPPIVLNKGLKLRLHEVRCIDETNPEWPGSDTIAMGGVAVSDTGTATKIREFQVGEGFDDGDRKKYNPARDLFTFSLANVTYPADFQVTIALAEKDSGGMAEFLQDLWEAIRDHVQVILSAVGLAAGATVGAWVGGTTGTAIAGPLGTIIGIIAGAVLGALVGWLISALQDDIFEPLPVAIRLPHPDSTFAGGRLYSPTQSLTFSDHGGTYRIYYSWLINR